MDEEQEFQNTFSDIERVHYSNKLTEMIPSDILLLHGNNKYKRLTRTQRFLISCDAILRNLIDQLEYRDLSDIKYVTLDKPIVSEDDINKILETTRSTDVEYKNPCAYILGYIVFKNLEKGKISKNYFKYAVVNILLPIVNDMGSNKNSWGVTEPDIIRYTNLWINLQ